MSFKTQTKFIEKFALSQNREEVINSSLVQGTDIWYYYSILNLLNKGVKENDEKIQSLLSSLKQHTGSDPSKVTALETRYKFLSFDYKNDVEKANIFKWIREKLKINYSSAPDLPYHESTLAPQYPSKLDTTKLDAFNPPQQFYNYSSLAHSRLSKVKSLTEEERTNILNGLYIPDLENLMDLVLVDFKPGSTKFFGSYSIHNQLTLAQLDKIRSFNPEVVNSTQFINSYVDRLAPPEGVDVNTDKQARTQYLQNLWKFVSSLPGSANSWKLTVLFWQLSLEKENGVYDLSKFVEYLSIPKQNAQNINSEWDAKLDKSVKAQLYQKVGFLHEPGDDTEFVLDFLHHFFSEEARDSVKPFNEYLSTTFLTELLAKTKLMTISEKADHEKWYNLWKGKEDDVENLKNQVILKFAPENTKYFGVNDTLSLKVELKNIPTLIVKVFEINTFSYFKKKLPEIDIDNLEIDSLNLDGLIANYENLYTYNDVLPLKKKTHEFKFPQLDKLQRGIFIIELIGGGKRIRSTFWKGQLRLVSELTTEGHNLYVLDENSTILKDKDTRIYLGGHVFHPDATSGKILVPFTTSAGGQLVLLSHQSFTTVASFYHSGVNYNFTAGFYVDRESLLKFEQAKVLVRAQLRVNDVEAPLSLLKEVVFLVSAEDKDNVPTQTRITDFPLFEDKGSEHVFLVPENTRKFTFSLSGKIRNPLSPEEWISVSQQKVFELNSIDSDSDITEDLHLSLAEDGYRINALGKSGEPKKGCVVQLEFKNKYLNQAIQQTLQTDETGVIYLGHLPDITEVSTPGVAAKLSKKSWPLTTNLNSYPNRIHASVGKRVSIPYSGPSTLTREAVSLLEYNRNSLVLHDRFEALKLDPKGYLEVTGLDPGNYRLNLKELNITISITIVAGISVGKNLVSFSNKIFQINSEKIPVQISSTEITKDVLKVHLSNTTKNTKVHLISTRFLPQYDIFSELGGYWAASGVLEQDLLATRHKVRYSLDENLSLEHCYILKRKYAPKIQGNLLPKPTFLLNPREVVNQPRHPPPGLRAMMRSKEAPHDLMPEAMLMRSMNPGKYSAMASNFDFLQERSREVYSYTPNLDFLTPPASTSYNLVPAADGTVSIPLSTIVGSYIRIVAIDGEDVAFKQLALPLTPFHVKDLRLGKQALDVSKHYTEQRQVSVVFPGTKFVIRDLSTAKMQDYGTLFDVYGILQSVSYNPDLKVFSWLLDWETLSLEQKTEKCSKYFSHEVNFFIYHKDKAFFDKVIYPFLKNKKDKDFMDYWLLGDDAALKQYSTLYEFDKLNCAEKILLGIRIKEIAEGVRTWVHGNTEALGDNLEEFHLLFNVALNSKGLDVGGTAVPLPPPEDHVPVRPSKQFFQPLEGIQQWAETGYWKQQKEDQNSQLIAVDKFWNDYAQHVLGEKRGSPFASKNFLYCRKNLTSIIFSLAVTDMPFKKVEHSPVYIEGRVELVAKTPTVYFHKEIRETEIAHSPILVSQNYFDPAEPKTHDETGQETDKYVSGEFLAYKPYATQVLLTNVSQSKHKLEVLRQIPAGAMPLRNGFFTEGKFIELSPNQTIQLFYYFYFPKAGETYQHYPVQISKNEKVIAYTTPTTLKVVSKLSTVDTKSWEYLSQQATTAELLSYLTKENFIAKKNDISRLAWRFQDRAVFAQVIPLLASKKVYSHNLWSYGLLHGDVEISREYLKRTSYFKPSLLPSFSSSLIEVLPKENFEYSEFFPLVNERIHVLSDNGPEIQNPLFSTQYNTFLDLLCYKQNLDDTDCLVAAFYLILQDRIEIAKEFLIRAEKSAKTEKYRNMELQRDYLVAYLDFFEPEPKIAAQIAKKYADYPIESWRKRFQTISQQLEEISGGREFKVTDEKDRNQKLTELAEKESSFDFSVEGKKISVDHRNLTEVTISFFPMDVELLFSTSAFSLQKLDQFSFVKPNQALSVKFPEKSGTHGIDIPKEFHNANFMITVEGAGSQKSQPFYSHSLEVYVFENSGQLRVVSRDNQRPLSSVYVKVYSLQYGNSVFYKDGYTDLRGRFDYATKNNTNFGGIEKFAILVFSETNGAVIKEVAPPKV